MVKLVASKGVNTTAVQFDLSHIATPGYDLEPGNDSNGFTADNGFVSLIATGHGLTYSGGHPSGGTIETFENRDSSGGALHYRLTGMALDVQTTLINPASLATFFDDGDDLKGSNQADTLAAFKGNDLINGRGGKDRIDGGRGADTMTGGSGRDTFDFNSAGDTGKSAATRDKITDFVSGEDKLDLSTIDANGSASGDPDFKFRSKEGADFTGVKGQIHWFQTDRSGTKNDKTIVEGDVNGDKAADFQIELSGLVDLKQGDFVL